jgi:hypothetical protein
MADKEAKKLVSLKTFLNVDTNPGEDEFTAANAKKRKQNEAASSEEFTSHDMWDPKTGEKKTAKTKAQHLALKAKGWDHERPTKDQGVDEELGDPNSAAKKPQKFKKPDGSIGIKMVPAKRAIQTEDYEDDAYSSSEYLESFVNDIDILESFINDTEQLDEVLSFTARRKKARSLKKNKAKIKMGRKKASKKMADIPRLKNRANKQARSGMFKKLAKGKSREDMGPAQRAQIEKRLDKMKGRIARIAKKSMPAVRKMAQVRLRSKKK